jgi:hypothetical protein
MDSSQSTVFPLLYISWGVITVVLVVLLSYRATLLTEDDQIFKETAQDYHQQEMTLIARKSRLTGEIIVLSVMSAVLLLTCVGFSI